MNAKELVDVIDWIESVTDDVGACGHKRSAVILNESAERLKALIPRYRPPQPSDDGKWCLLELYKNDLPKLYKIVQYDDGSWWYSESPRIKRSLLTGNVWPCERPE